MKPMFLNDDLPSSDVYNMLPVTAPSFITVMFLIVKRRVWCLMVIAKS